MRRLPMVLMALLLAAAPPALAASGKDRGGSPQARAKVTATANPAKARSPATAAAPRATSARRGEARVAAPASRRSAATASSRSRPAAAASSRRGRIAADSAARRQSAEAFYGRQARLTWTSYGTQARSDRFLSSASAATVPRACGKRSRRGCATGSVSWHRDLPPAANVQAMACPAGTMATLATGHSDVVRCMPL